MLFGDEQIYVSDPLALHCITVKDQYIYDEADMFYATNALIFGNGLLATSGDVHRKQRKMMNPVFSLKHMRDMIPIFYPIAYQLREVLTNQVRKGVQELDLLSWSSRAALEYIGQGGFGYSFDALHESKTNQFGEAVRLLSTTNFRLTFYRQFLPWVSNVGPPNLRRWAAEHCPIGLVRLVTQLAYFTYGQAEHIFEEKKRALKQGDESVATQDETKKDIMSVLLKANMMAKEEDRLPDDQLLGQINTFILAGQNTTSTAISRVLHLLTLHPEVQTRLREEVTAARQEHGDLDYDTLMNLPYLDAVCRETLRRYPPVPSVLRTTRKDIVMPLMWPIRSADGKSELKEIPLKKNTGIIVSILNANTDKRIWGEDAEEWKPERWLKALPQNVSETRLPGVYSSIMTFFGGGRACIGFKFAEMELKLVLSILLETFVFAIDKEVIWKTSTLVYPTVKGGDGRPQLPLKLSFVKA